MPRPCLNTFGCGYIIRLKANQNGETVWGTYEYSFNFLYAAGTGTGTDTTAPVISGCPSGASAVTSTPGASAAIVSWVEPTATDNDGQAVTVSRSQAPSTAFNIGSTAVSYVFTDTAGNQATCTFNVVVTPGNYMDQEGETTCRPY